MRPDELRPGMLLVLDREASVQFTAEPITFRVIKVGEPSGYDDWTWLEGYQLNAAGEAVERRSLFVQWDGLRLAEPAPQPDPAARTRPPGRPAQSHTPPRRRG